MAVPRDRKDVGENYFLFLGGFFFSLDVLYLPLALSCYSCYSCYPHQIKVSLRKDFLEVDSSLQPVFVLLHLCPSPLQRLRHARMLQR